MNFENVYAAYREKVSSIVSTQEDIEQINELQHFLEQNSKTLREKEEGNQAVMALVILIGGFLLVLLLLSLKNAGVIFFLLSLGVMLVVFLLVFLFQAVTRTKVHSSILFLKSIIQEGWKFDFRDSEELWIEYDNRYPFLNSGDVSNSVDLCVNGTYEEYAFHFFEYDYTIEVEEEVEYRDDDGEIYFETEYHEESYTETCVAIYVDNDLPVIAIDPRKSSDALKFSYIEMNERLAVYTSTPQSTHKFFDPETQKMLVQIYRLFPIAQIHINQERIFINFKSDLFPYDRAVNFDEELYKKLDNDVLVELIKKILNPFIPFCRQMEEFRS